MLNNGIENGTDKLNEEYMLGKNLIKSTFLYVVIAFLVSVLFVALTNTIMAGVMGA